jgi:hypothetical protein
VDGTKRFFWLVVSIAALAAGGNAQVPAGKPEVFVIHGPTIVAFFHPISQKELDNGEGDAEAGDDFSYYSSLVRKPLKSAGIRYETIVARSFRVRVGKKIRVFHTGEIGIGYYFIAPGKEPHVEEGVMTDDDLVDEARKYFGIKIRYHPNPVS